MYYSDQDLYAMAKIQHEERMREAGANRLAALCRKGSPLSRPKAVARLGAFLVSVGQKLQNE